MLLLINIIIGLFLAYATSLFKQLRESVQGEIFCGIFYLIEIIECFSKRTVRIYSSNAILSIIFLIILPFIVFFFFMLIKGFIDTKKKDDRKQEIE